MPNNRDNIVDHLAALIVPMVDDARSHRGKVIHYIQIAEDTIGRPIYTPHFSVDNAGSVLEYPNGRVINGQYRWVATTWGPDGDARPNSLFEPPGRRLHNSLQAFADSVFNRLSVQWDDLIDSEPEDDDGTPWTRALEVTDNWSIFYEDGRYALGDTKSFVLLSVNSSAKGNEAAVKSHFLRLLRDIQITVYAADGMT